MRIKSKFIALGIAALMVASCTGKQPKAVIEKLQPEFNSLASELTTMRMVGVCVFSLETKDKHSSVHSRFFAPNYGINEDPVTGSANGPLGFYLHKYVLPAGYPVACREMPDGGVEFVGEQGDSIKRSGRVKIRLRFKQKTVEDLSIAGEAITILDSTLKL